MLTLKINAPTSTDLTNKGAHTPYNDDVCVSRGVIKMMLLQRMKQISIIEEKLLLSSLNFCQEEADN
jgi:hypothetical protein